MSNGTIAALSVLVLVNVCATLAVLRLEVLTTQQKSIQCLMVWMVPVLGAVLGLVFSQVAAKDTASQQRAFPAAAAGDGGAFGPGLCETNFSCKDNNASCEGGD